MSEFWMIVAAVIVGVIIISVIDVMIALTITLLDQDKKK